MGQLTLIQFSRYFLHKWVSKIKYTKVVLQIYQLFGNAGLLDYLECRDEDGNKPGYQRAFMPRIQRKRILPGLWRLWQLWWLSLFCSKWCMLNIYLLIKTGPCFGFYLMNIFSILPTIARMRAEMAAPGPVGLPVAFNGPSPDQSPVETVRTFFPETWIWDLVEVGWVFARGFWWSESLTDFLQSPSTHEWHGTNLLNLLLNLDSHFSYFSTMYSFYRQFLLKWCMGNGVFGLEYTWNPVELHLSFWDLKDEAYETISHLHILFSKQ